MVVLICTSTSKVEAIQLMDIFSHSWYHETSSFLPSNAWWWELIATIFLEYNLKIFI